MSKGWHGDAIYQIFPRSLQDSNGDGESDIRRLIRRLDYLARFGIVTIWLNAIYELPLLAVDTSQHLYRIEPTRSQIEPPSGPRR